MVCAVAHSGSIRMADAVRSSPRTESRIRVVVESGKIALRQCRHCAAAPCALVCPTGAIEKTEVGIVQLSDELCTGCRLCIDACPFGGIFAPIEEKTVIKCDLCRERLAEGKEPACVEACPTGAIRFEEPENVEE